MYSRRQFWPSAAHAALSAGSSASGGHWLTMALPGREAEFRDAVGRALEYAGVIGNDRVHVMAGLVPADADRARYRATYLENVAFAAKAAAAQGVTIVLEPINTRDMPGYFLNRQDDAQAICKEVGAANLKVQFDCYHCQIVEGDIAMKLKRDMPGIGHIQIAAVPTRAEPDEGEVSYERLLETIEGLGYRGFIGAEYRARAEVEAGLGWLKAFRAATP